MALTAAERAKRYRERQKGQEPPAAAMPAQIDVGEVARATMDAAVAVVWSINPKTGILGDDPAEDLASFRQRIASGAPGLNSAHLRALFLVSRRLVEEPSELAVLDQGIMLMNAVHLRHAARDVTAAFVERDGA